MKLFLAFAILWLAFAGFIIWDKIPKEPKSEAELQCIGFLQDPAFKQLSEAKL